MFNFPNCFLLALIGTGLAAQAEPILPTTVGATWEYAVTAAGPTASPPSTLTVRITGTEKSRGKELLRFDTLEGDDLMKAELVAVDDRGVVCYERTLGNGRTTPFNPPFTLVPAALKSGAKWELDDFVAGSEMHQQFTVTGEEDIVVPAGTFHAYRFQCGEPWPLSVTVERWFVPGTGFVKDVTTTRGPSGRLVNRVTMALRKFTKDKPPEPEKVAPSVEVSPESSSTPSPPQLHVEVAKERDGEAVTEFRSDVPNIYVRWSGQHLPTNAGVRIAWIAEDVGDVAPANFVVDETETLVTTPEFGARFTLSRPKDGWAPGKYRIELYLDDVPTEKLSVTIRD